MDRFFCYHCKVVRVFSKALWDRHRCNDNGCVTIDKVRFHREHCTTCTEGMLAYWETPLRLERKLR